jgi:hypothetical protein
VPRERQIGIAKQLFAAMDIARDDKDKRQDWVLRGFRQFDAPVSIVVTFDLAIHGSDIAPCDCGGVVNCIVNAAWSRGLGCVINSRGIMQSPVVRAEAGIADDQVIQTCIAMAWPDDSFPRMPWCRNASLCTGQRCSSVSMREWPPSERGPARYHRRP